MENKITLAHVADEINYYFFDPNEECYGISEQKILEQISYYDKYFSDRAEFDEQCKELSTLIKNYLKN